jgi:hypothetical protein
MRRRSVTLLIVLIGLIALPFAVLGLDYVMQKRVMVTVIKSDVPGYGIVGYGWYQTRELFRLGCVYHQFLSYQHGGQVSRYLITSTRGIPAPSPWREVRLWASRKQPGVWVSVGANAFGTLDLRTGEFLGLGGYRMDPSRSLSQQAGGVREDGETHPFPAWASPKDSKLLAKFTKDDFWNWIHRGRPTTP